ncbi:virulence factor [Hephaestia sp. GCM10023244]|uniref:virulence factor n=1 Tax=unclassified Hephaestia TaxID=2631281 RepID=UPI002076F638|nr:virulence factor [Hephaestia sp. MAHUQ-44]MCM8729882.1 virulence factor [Hephaestia sp. MAHUQ-44]
MNRLKKWLVGGIGAVALALGFLAYIGYLGGSPFVTIPATAQPEPAMAGLTAVVLSGDMGFRIGMAPRIARKLAADGIPVVGVNSLTFFRHKRTPREVSALIETAVRRALAHPHTDKIVLIGQSFGADMLHVGLADMPASLRARVQMIALVVPGDTVTWRASPADLFNWGATTPALPTARMLHWAPVICIYGAEESTSLCPRLHLPNSRSITLPGGHPLHRDVDTLARVIVKAIKATSVSGPTDGAIAKVVR